jgi:galactose-1-phosphate uridylyltransferase
VELEDAEKYFQSEKFQVGYQAYVMESKEQAARIEHEISERARKQAELAASPEYQKELDEKKTRIEKQQMRDTVKQEILQILHDALAQAGANCEDYDDDYRCC